MSVFALTWLYFSLGEVLGKATLICGLVTATAGATWVVSSFLASDECYPEVHKARAAKAIPVAYKFAKAWAVFLILGSFIPGETRLMKIVGIGSAYHLTQTDEAKKLPDNVLKAVNSFLEGVAANKNVDNAKK